jgi:F420-dependent oxidoreductase-like protein
MSLKIGVHTGPQDLSIDELKKIWLRSDEAGFHWVSVWDHFYANPLQSRDNTCFEGVASMAALAAMTKNVRVGCLVFCALFRNPGLLAKAAMTIDHLSGGRAEIGVGAGWFEEEFREFGYGFPPLGKRMDQLEEALQVIHSLWHEPETNFKGQYYDLQGAVCGPKPLGARLWIGGRGKVRTPTLAAKYGDGLNFPYLSPDQVKDRLQQLDQACDKQGRDRGEIETSVNVGFYMSSGGNTQPLPPADSPMAQGSLIGPAQQVIDRIGEYHETGIQGLNIAFRPPVEWDAFENFIADVLPVFHS